MEGLEEKLGAVLNNPQLMQQLMSMARSLGAQAPQEQEAPKEAAPELDLAMLQKLGSMAKQSGIDKQQQALLQALCPYLSKPRIDKLEKAMRAAKMAKLASAVFSQGGIPFLSGR